MHNPSTSYSYVFHRSITSVWLSTNSIDGPRITSLTTESLPARMPREQSSVLTNPDKRARIPLYTKIVDSGTLALFSDGWRNRAVTSSAELTTDDDEGSAAAISVSSGPFIVANVSIARSAWTASRLLEARDSIDFCTLPPCKGDCKYNSARKISPIQYCTEIPNTVQFSTCFVNWSSNDWWLWWLCYYCRVTV